MTIVGDLFVPWHAGTGALYSTEHFAAVSRRLHEGGVFAQQARKALARSLTIAQEREIDIEAELRRHER